MADLSPAEVALTRTAQGVWLDADARELVLAEIALLRHELREATTTAERLQADTDVAVGWLAVLLHTATICPECRWRLPAHRRGCDLKEAWLSDSPVSAADGEIPPSQDATGTGEVLTAEEDASAGAWLAYLGSDSAPALRATADSDGDTDRNDAGPPPPADQGGRELVGLPWPRYFPHLQAPSGEAPHAEASAGAQDATAPHPARCNARNKRGGALCTRPAKANGRCGRHPLRQTALNEPQGMGPAATGE